MKEVSEEASEEEKESKSESDYTPTKIVDGEVVNKEDLQICKIKLSVPQSSMSSIKSESNFDLPL